MIEHDPLLRLWYERRPAKLTLQKCVQCQINLKQKDTNSWFHNGTYLTEIKGCRNAGREERLRAGFPDFETKTMTTGKYAKSLLVSSEVIQQTSDVDDIPDKPTNQPQKVSSPAPSHHIRKCHQNSSHQLELDNFGQDVFSSGQCHFFYQQFAIYVICKYVSSVLLKTASSCQSLQCITSSQSPYVSELPVCSHGSKWSVVSVI